MSIKSDLENTLKDAMRAKDDTRKGTMRMALSEIKLAEVKKQEDLDDDAVIRILQKEVKSRRESIEDAKKADRSDIIASSKAEMAILEEFLPKGLSPQELEKLVKETISEVGASAPGDMGNVMKAVLPKVAGRADGGQISQIVRDSLQNA